MIDARKAAAQLAGNLDLWIPGPARRYTEYIDIIEAGLVEFAQRYFTEHLPAALVATSIGARIAARDKIAAWVLNEVAHISSGELLPLVEQIRALPLEEL
jgi:hypothetical protein